ncbi:MAG: putative phage tail protein [bacterium]
MLLNYLPSFMQEIREVYIIMNILDPEVDELYNKINFILNSMFIFDTNELSIAIYEDMLGIIPKSSDSILDRQNAILELYNFLLPFTYHNLIITLNYMCGESNYIIIINSQELLLTLTLELNVKNLFSTIEQFFEKFIPMNVLFNIHINYNIWGDLLNYTWSQVSNITWEHAKESEEIKYG